MLKRIVKMTFREEAIPNFLEMFEAKKSLIRSFPGCQHLELWQSKTDSSIFFTYSFWQSENDLENYRQSDLFKETWKETKSYFAEKPAAWSVEGLEYLP